MLCCKCLCYKYLMFLFPLHGNAINGAHIQHALEYPALNGTCIFADGQTYDQQLPITFGVVCAIR